MCGFPRGQELPALSPVRESKEQNKQLRKDEKEEENNLTDAELFKQDVVKVIRLQNWVVFTLTILDASF